ncbi:MAG: Tryptophan synthase alpha chain [Myxococcales bacterium]|nr:Tryptophan synthase alpha chain [Myxococcales bacterium]
MKLLLLGVVALGLASAACQQCPDGNKGDSLFCHGASCAADENVCSGACSNPMSDRDNCGKCGMQCGDGLVCSFGVCAAGCDNGLVNCGGSCVDPSMDKANCGGCGATDTAHVCTPDETCNNGVCGCATTDIVCAGTCTNPQTSSTHCGASGDCGAGHAGTMCAQNEACVAGGCISKLIYRGSLPAGTGRWMYAATLGIDGANNDCAAHWPGSAICPFNKLMAASVKGETVNAVDYNNNPVTEWWMDQNTVGEGRCISNADMAPWTYATADQGHVGRHVTLDRATGVISAAPVLETIGTGCNINRFVACCSLVVAP